MCLECIPARYCAAVMLFLASVLQTTVQSNFSMALLAMADMSCRNENGALVTPSNYGTRYKWSLHEQCLLLGTLSAGWSVSLIPSGYLIEKFRIAKSTIFYSLFLVAGLQFVISIAAATGYIYLLVTRLLMGILMGFMGSSMHTLSANWTLPTELDHYTIILVGSNVSMMITSPIFGVIIHLFGWSSTFCIPAYAAIVLAICWQFLMFENPALHPRISVAEKNRFPRRDQKEQWFTVCMSSMLKSAPFWALMCLHWASAWCYNLIALGVPLFFYKVLGFTLATTCFLVGIAFAARLSVGMLTGLIVQCFKSTNCISQTAMRKGLCVFSHLIPGVLMLFVPFYGDRPVNCFALILFSFGISGAAAKTNFLNVAELAPNFTESLLAILNATACISGFVVPICVAVFTTERNTMDEWRTIFWISSGMYIFSGILFMLLGSARIQSWNENAKTQDFSTINVLYDRPRLPSTDVYF